MMLSGPQYVAVSEMENLSEPALWKEDKIDVPVLMMTGALRGLFAVAENYPQLKANDNFLRLQNRISELEERIADRREFFNDDVNTYNTRIHQLPEVFLANLMALKPREFFKVSDEDRKMVEVNLA